MRLGSVALSAFLTASASAFTSPLFHQEQIVTNASPWASSFVHKPAGCGTNRNTALRVSTVQNRDFYKILECPRSSDVKEIKSAYRKMAKRYHPDANPGKDTTEKFQVINRAYEILSNPDLKFRYDKVGERGVGTSASTDEEATAGAPFSSGYRAQEVDFNGSFENSYGGGGRGGWGQGPQGTHTRERVGKRREAARREAATSTSQRTGRSPFRGTGVQGVNNNDTFPSSRGWGHNGVEKEKVGHQGPRTRERVGKRREEARREAAQREAPRREPAQREPAPAPKEKTRRSPFRGSRGQNNDDIFPSSGGWGSNAGGQEQQEQRTREKVQNTREEVQQSREKVQRTRERVQQTREKVRRAYESAPEQGVGTSSSQASDIPTSDGFRGQEVDCEDIVDTFPEPKAAGPKAAGPKELETHQVGQSARGTIPGGDLRLDLEVDFKMLCSGGEEMVRIRHLENCDTCGGSGMEAGSNVNTCRCCNGQGATNKMKQINVAIPGGVEAGHKLRVKAEGNAGPNGGPSGDLFIFLKMKTMNVRRREKPYSTVLMDFH